MKSIYKINKLCKKLDLNSQVIKNKEIIKKEKEVIIVNSFGKLPEFFKYSKSIFVGKSVLKKFEQIGGQNPIEAAKLGCKIYHGPFVYNFKEIYSLLRSYKISHEVKNENDLFIKLMIDFKKTKRRKQLSQKISFMGDKILNNSVKEINKILIK